MTQDKKRRDELSTQVRFCIRRIQGKIEQQKGLRESGSVVEFPVRKDLA